MITQPSIRYGAARRPAARLLMMLCGLAGAALAASAGAAAPDANSSDQPKLAIRFAPQELTTDEGTRRVYQRLVSAAADVCPGPVTGTRLLSEAAQRCRNQAVADAVRKINNSRLAAVYSTTVKMGS